MYIKLGTEGGVEGGVGDKGARRVVNIRCKVDITSVVDMVHVDIMCMVDIRYVVDIRCVVDIISVGIRCVVEVMHAVGVSRVEVSGRRAWPRLAATPCPGSAPVLDQV
jgi:hypothetical protein